MRANRANEVLSSDRVIKPGRVQRLLASYHEKVKSGEIKPEESKSGQEGTGEPQEPNKKLKIGDLGLPFISAHIG